MAYAENLKRAIQIAQSLAKENYQAEFAPPHLLMALFHNEIGLASLLASIGKDIHYLRDWAEVRIENMPKSARMQEHIPGNEQIKATMEVAELIRLQLSKEWIDALCVLIAILKPGLAFSADQLKSLPLTQKDVLEAALEEARLSGAVGVSTTASTDGAAGTTANIGRRPAAPADALYKYCIDKTALAAEGRLDPIIGRDRETRMMAEILGRRTKPNVIIIGEPGVGKTALVDGFALSIHEKKVPVHLQSAHLFELDTGALVAGASYKGEIEDRLKNIIKELKQFEKAILFIDEIHSLLDSKGSIGSGAANLLKPELARGELTLIGATTNDEYRQFIESDEAFSRRFEILRVEEPDLSTATRMLKHLLPYYEEHHSIKVAEDAIQETVRLAKRYIKDRRLPDAAIDLLDRTMAAIRMMDETSRGELELLQKELDELSILEEVELMAELRWFHNQLKNKVSHILLNQLEEENNIEEIDSADVLREHLYNTLKSLLTLTEVRKEQVEKNDIAAIISHKTGIPLGKIQSKERDKLLNMDEVLKRRVVGQDHAVKAMAEAILESRSGLIKAGQPIGSFFLLGPTGTGKTELAKALADFLFNDESFLIRFDMSEFKEEHSAALLYGAPPGYVGYEEGGLLVNKIRQKPYSVVLFDEIEKAHPSVFDIFLQILDEGRLHDRLGKEGDFSNAVILFTSNIGSEFVAGKFQSGQIPQSADLMEIMSKYFRPEFLARLTEIVPFAPISEENVVKIFEIHLRSLTDLMAKQGIGMEISSEAKKHLAMAGFTPRYGVRPLKGVIRNQLRRPVSRMIISGELKKGDELRVGLDQESQQITWEVHPVQVPA
jgi:ATP-dependent Clp protease ATP-binding subunit ClpA